MRLGIYMGSFNPPHQGHIGIVNFLLQEQYLDNILIVPTLNYWDKQDLAPIEHRINMLKYFENEHVKVDTSHNQYIYTIDLINELKKDYPTDELYLILGADNIIYFDKWKNYEELLHYPILVINRNNIDINPLIRRFNNGHFIIINDYPSINVSSTEIRENLSSPYLDTKVLKYIKKNSLYTKKI